MSLAELIDEAAADRTTLRVYAPVAFEGLEERLAPRNVAVRHVELPADAGAGFAVVRRGDEFVGTVSLSGLAELTDPGVQRIGSPELEGGTLRRVLELLDDTVFGSLDRRQLLAAAREIEDRAFRAGRGTLLTGFQNVDAMRAQTDVYRRLGAVPGLDVHLFAAADGEPPSLPGVESHLGDDPEIASTWFVVYDGGDEPANACALLAREREPDRYQGFWTYDRDRVAAAVEVVEAAMDDG